MSDAHLADAPPGDIEHLHDQALKVQLLARCGHFAKLGVKKAAERIERFVGGECRAEHLAHVVERRARVKHVRAVGLLPEQRLFARVVFILDLADDLFQNIFDGHQPGHAAVFIHDNRYVDMALLQFLEQVAHALGFRNKIGWPNDARQRNG